MILLSAHNLGRQFAGDPVFRNLAFEIRAGDRIGLVGPNGAGKSTLLRLLAGLDTPDYGVLSVRPGIRVALLKQQPDFEAGQTLFQVARSGLASLIDLQRELEEAAQEIAEADDDADRLRATRRFEQIQEQIEHQDAYAIDHRIEQILLGLRFRSQDFHRPAATFSGGQQSRLMLAKLLLQSPDLMLLDEPSNHLDIETTEWLEAYLSRQPVAMVIVSHDRQFLDAVVTQIWELQFGELTIYPGHFSQYWKLREERARLLDRQRERVEETIADLKDFIARNKAGQKSRQAKDRERKLERIEQVQRIRDVEAPPMGFGSAERSGDIVIEARHLSKAYAQPLFSDFNIQIQRGQSVGIVGPNGAGKTTLLKLLIGRERPDAGEVRLGHKVSIGYYDQELASLPPDTPLIRAVQPEDDPDWVEQDTRDLLARFGLKGDVVFQTVGQLSGGEKGKAALARLAATEANLLVMDEPTNHLDFWSCAALERSIREFDGTVLVVSHDRYFLNQVADRIIEVAGGQARVFEGDYSAYRYQRDQLAAARRNPQEAAAAQPKTPASGPAEKPRRRRRFPYRKTADIERELAAVEAELAEAQAALADPATYRDPDSARAAQARYDELVWRHGQLYEHWEEALELNN
ncbi:MAG: ABC transporter [Isosphaeraceae bacterium]|jgi:ATP-binding cassette subfamily F protein 3|nr:MAG: ABC transporter [Isosphaeraceae bacterium]